MASALRTLGVATTLGLLLGGLTSCTAADRAILQATRCSDATATPVADRHQPGRAVLMSPAVRSSLPLGPIAGWEEVVSVADGRTTLAAVHPDGTVSVVGVDHEGLLAGTGGGAGETVIPRPVPGVTDAVAVAAVGSAFLVTHSDGTVTAWGEGFLADGGRRSGDYASSPPAPVADVENVLSVSDGALSVLALRSDGGITGWGVNLTQLRGEEDGTRVRTISDAPGSVSIANPGDAAVVATGTGEVCAWGNNTHGLLGVEPPGGQTPRPVRVGTVEGVTHVAAGIDFALARDEAGRVWGWGRTVSGMLGDGTVADTSTATPQQVPGLPPVQRIFASDSASYAIDAEGGLWGWGKNRREAPYESADLLPRLIPLPGPAQEVSGNVVLTGPPS